MKRRALTAEEKELWHTVTRNDAPLPNHSPFVESVAAPAAFPGNAPRRAELFSPLPPMPMAIELSCGAYAGIDRNTADRFRKGDYAIDATLDLHGMSREKAHRALNVFIHREAEQHRRCLLVITGKGIKNMQDASSPPGILREMLPHWLQEPGLRPLVLAYDVAKPKHGGTGAFYILLRRKR